MAAQSQTLSGTEMPPEAGLETVVCDVADVRGGMLELSIVPTPRSLSDCSAALRG